MNNKKVIFLIVKSIENEALESGNETIKEYWKKNNEQWLSALSPSVAMLVQKDLYIRYNIAFI